MSDPLYGVRCTIVDDDSAGPNRWRPPYWLKKSVGGPIRVFRSRASAEVVAIALCDRAGHPGSWVVDVYPRKYVVRWVSDGGYFSGWIDNTECPIWDAEDGQRLSLTEARAVVNAWRERDHHHLAIEVVK